jgi:hypothetical protein
MRFLAIILVFTAVVATVRSQTATSWGNLAYQAANCTTHSKYACYNDTTPATDCRLPNATTGCDVVYGRSSCAECFSSSTHATMQWCAVTKVDGTADTGVCISLTDASDSLIDCEQLALLGGAYAGIALTGASSCPLSNKTNCVRSAAYWAASNVSDWFLDDGETVCGDITNVLAINDTTTATDRRARIRLEYVAARLNAASGAVADRFVADTVAQARVWINNNCGSSVLTTDEDDEAKLIIAVLDDWNEGRAGPDLCADDDTGPDDDGDGDSNTNTRTVVMDAKYQKIALAGLILVCIFAFAFIGFLLMHYGHREEHAYAAQMQGYRMR